jgi:ankyrin repeat protein
VLLGRTSIVALLLKHGANPNAGDDEECTPLHYAAEADSKSFIDRLVGYGAAVDAVDHYGNTALHRAAALGKERAISALIAAGANPSLTNAAGQTAGNLARASAEKAQLLNPERVKHADRIEGRGRQGRN